LEDLAVTVTHLSALHTAIHGNVSSSRFAVVVEDDVLLPFDVDWQRLAESAPPGFGMLRLVSSVEVNEYLNVSFFIFFSIISACGGEVV